MKKIVFSFFIAFLFSTSYAQEFNCNVTINTPKLQLTDPKVFKSLQTAIREFMNNRKWSEQEYAPEERIDLDLILNITTELSATAFEGQLTVVASRPVYNSGYNSILFRHLDKQIIFSYGEFEVLDFSENTFTSNLTSTLAFYAYIILGLDEDSFYEMGGDAHLAKAQTILNSVPRSSIEGKAIKGWTVDGGGITDRTRYWLIENLLNVRVANYRRAMYQYHLMGLDLLTKDETMGQGMGSIVKALEAINKVNSEYPSSMIVQLFSDAKRQEILNVFSVADSRMRRQVYDIMVKIDGTHTNDYKVLLN